MERLSDYLQSDSNSSIRRIFLAHQVQKEIKKELGEEVAVGVAVGVIKIKSTSTAQKIFLKNKKLFLDSLVKKIIKTKARLVIT